MLIFPSKDSFHEKGNFSPKAPVNQSRIQLYDLNSVFMDGLRGGTKGPRSTLFLSNDNKIYFLEPQFLDTDTLKELKSMNK